MKIGMLWFNNDPKMGFKEKVLGAVSYYKDKYGEKPTVVCINPKQQGIEEIPGMTIIKDTGHSVWINHFWIGKE